MFPAQRQTLSPQCYSRWWSLSASSTSVEAGLALVGLWKSIAEDEGYMIDGGPMGQELGYLTIVWEEPQLYLRS